MYALILAGGVGTRLWPKSRKALPKQFLNLTGTETMIQTSVRRILPLIPPENIFVATGERYVNLVRKQLQMLPEKNIVAEISGKNTAPAIGLGALHIARNDKATGAIERKSDSKATMAVLTADHIIPDEDTFRHALQAAFDVAETGKLVTLGITPTYPATGYGYIQRGNETGIYQNQTVYQVEQFLEKPNLITAQQFCDSGNHYWNSGMFIWQVKTFFTAIKEHMPTLSNKLDELKSVIFDGDRETTVKIWQSIRPESIDFGLMEKVNNVVVVPLKSGWNDVGSWTALYEELQKTSGENVVVDAELISIDSHDIFIHGTGKLVATIGLQNVAIIETDDALLVCSLDKTQDVKHIVNQLKEQHKTTYL
ncbi:MAG: hypothetical protein B6242_03005 [Anaerolineaceae bacterium 4572_78]|nr:MAG: hypothetical protein B6242_03005 [Anaerolineaceae bacterium 4572_78]